MSAAIDILSPDSPKRVLILASNPAVSEKIGWPIGFWWAELTRPYWEFTKRGYRVDVASPDGGKLEGDAFSDPRDASGYSADDLPSLGFINSPEHARLVEQSKPLADVAVDANDAVLLVGGQGPMYTFWSDERVHRLVTSFYEAGKLAAVICHATCVLLKTRLTDGRLLEDDKTWTGFANSEEQYADDFAGQKIQPFWIEDEAQAREHQLHPQQPLQTARGQGWHPHHRSAAVLRRRRGPTHRPGARGMNTIPPAGDAPLDRRRHRLLPADQTGLELIGRLRSVAAERSSIFGCNDRGSKRHQASRPRGRAPGAPKVEEPWPITGMRTCATRSISSLRS